MTRANAIRYWHAQGAMQKEIASHVGIAQPSVSKAIRRLGLVPFRRGQRHGRTPTP